MCIYVSIAALIHVTIVPQGPLEQTPPSVLAALAHGFEQRDVECSKPTHKIRVDFKVGHVLQYKLLIYKFASNIISSAGRVLMSQCYNIELHI